MQKTHRKSAAARALASLRKRGLAGFLGNAAADMRDLMQHKAARIRDHGGKFQFAGQPLGSKVLIVVLAGYKPSLWPLTLARIKRFAPPGADICVTTAGKHVPELASWCREHGCGYLWTEKNKTGLVLNKAISAHPAAEWIFKIDEDIFISKGFFEDMLSGCLEVKSQGRHNPGFCAPTLNINGVSYLNFLRVTCQADSYREMFGGLRSACDGIPVHSDPAAAIWIWSNTLPLDDVAARFSATREAGTPVPYEVIGTRFSIGAVLLERAFLEEIGGFRSTWRQGMLGIDEQALCVTCVDRSRVMLYFPHILAGHFSFQPQDRAMQGQLPAFTITDPATFSRP